MLLGPSSPLPSPSAWARLAGGGVLSSVWCSSFCIVLLLFCFQVMTAASAPTTYVTPPAASSVLPPLVARPSPPPWVQRMQADDTSPNKRSVAMWGGNQSTKYLVTSNQWTLIVTDNGTVMGVRAKEKRPTFGILEFFTLAVWTMTTSSPGSLLTAPSSQSGKSKDLGRVAIRGRKAGRFICMNSSSRVYSSPTFTDECEFQEEHLENRYNVYYSLKYMGDRRRKHPKRKWYLGINRRGKMRLGYRTKQNREYAQFINTPISTHFQPGQHIMSPTAPRTTRRPQIRRPDKKNHRRGRTRDPDCVSSGPFSRCTSSRDSAAAAPRRTESERNKQKKRKRKKPRRRHRYRGWGRRRNAGRSHGLWPARSGVPLLS